jgi:poly(ADP-ribose) glycohydrolase ARH3
VIDAARKLQLKKFLKKREEDGTSTIKLSYTDDTAMTRSVAKCLVSYDAGTYQKDLAVHFVKEYFVAPKRGYGAGVTELFNELRRIKFDPLLQPASRQFGGNGSFGNGAAMRVSPVALYCLNKSEDFLIDLVKKTSVITHSNVIGVNGAILQALAIHQNLKMDPAQGLDANKYLDKIIQTFKTIEKGEDE